MVEERKRNRAYEPASQLSITIREDHTSPFFLVRFRELSEDRDEDLV